MRRVGFAFLLLSLLGAEAMKRNIRSDEDALPG